MINNNRMNEKLNFRYFIISIIALLLILILDKLFMVKIDVNIYIIIITSSIVALGNYIVILLQRRNSERVIKAKSSRR